MKEELTTTIQVPKTPEEQLKQLIEASCLMFEKAKGIKSTPLKTLWREEKLNFEFVMSEIELIKNKKSNLSTGQREAVTALVATAIRQFELNQRANKDKQNSTDN